MVTDDGKEVMSEGGYQIIPFRAFMKDVRRLIKELN